jgi:hypothetical protein
MTGTVTGPTDTDPAPRLIRANTIIQARSSTHVCRPHRTRTRCFAAGMRAHDLSSSRGRLEEFAREVFFDGGPPPAPSGRGAREESATVVLAGVGAANWQWIAPMASPAPKSRPHRGHVHARTYAGAAPDRRRNCSVGHLHGGLGELTGRTRHVPRDRKSISLGRVCPS